MASRNGHQPSVGDISDQYLVCRDLGHNWAPHDVHFTRHDIQRTFKCRHCETLRHQTLTRAGYIVAGRTRYEYPEQQTPDADPYVVKGLGRLSVDDRAAIRVASSQRMRSS